MVETQETEPKVYISGPISGIPDYLANFETAELYAKLFLACSGEDSCKIFNPARFFEEAEWLGYETIMEMCLDALGSCSHIFMAEGWQNSPGARREHRFAVSNGINVIEYGKDITVQTCHSDSEAENWDEFCEFTAPQPSLPQEVVKGKKYEFTDEKIDYSGHTLYRIRALRDIVGPDGQLIAKAGQRGGFIEYSGNLSQMNSCWVNDLAKVYGDAQVYSDAQVYGYAYVYGEAQLYGQAQVYENAQVYGEAHVYGNAKVYDYAQVYENAQVCGEAKIYGEARVFGDALVVGKACIFGQAQIAGTAKVGGQAQLGGKIKTILLGGTIAKE